MARQLILDIGLPPSYDADDFLESPSNGEARAMVERWPDWPDRTLVVVGPPGAGKSHLGSIWAQRTSARIYRSGDPIRLDRWSGAALVEDGDRASFPEADLFHLLNLTHERDGWLMITARTAPDLWSLKTRDLLSRLRRALLVRIGQPDAALLRAVIVKLFADRQIFIDEDVVAYAARHCEQSLEAVSRFVAAVDEAGLTAGRRITRPFAISILAALDNDDTEIDGPAIDDQAITRVDDVTS